MHRATKRLLVAVSRLLERQAASMGVSAVLLGTFQRAGHFTPVTAARYAGLAAGAAFVAAFATGLPHDPAGDVRGVALSPDDGLAQEWDVVVLGPHFAAALLSRDLGDSGPDEYRRFDYRVTYDRDTVIAAATLLLRQVPAALL